ncbi:MAG TPA: glutathione S-transferase N-terminal domain-containing protein [Thermodesulfobacteriota bacterium]|nr:glutathione S-transferase N-terminal domain-containing protein [Thermodesulfobacteriota bacterium]
MPEYTLYIKPQCPYCVKVMNYMKQRNIELPLKNLNDSADIREELISIGGKGQVPCLVIDGVAMYESSDIIKYLRNEYGNNS